MLLVPLATALIALVLSVLSLYKAKKYKAEWMYYFSGGAFLHFLAFLILSVFNGKGYIYAIPLLPTGLGLLVYSVMKILYWEEARKAIYASLLVGSVYVITSLYAIWMRNLYLLSLATGLLTFILPAYAFHTLLTLYSYTKDRLALVFAAAFVLYFLGTTISPLMISNVEKFAEALALPVGASFGIMLFSILLA